jgi:[ribosomal protein S5]-alanine N-acetyltransferase
VAARASTSNGPGPFPVLVTPRLVLREVTLEDAGWYLRHFSYPEVVHGQGYAAPADIDAAREEIRRYFVDLYADGAGIRWGLAHREAPAELIGSAGFYRWTRDAIPRAELGYDLAPSAWGRGLMGETLGAVLRYGRDRMGLVRVEATVLTDNARSIRILERLGFVREGVLVAHGPDEQGRLRDEYAYVLRFSPAPDAGLAVDR